MTWILFLLCIAIAGRELYLAFERRRPAVPDLTGLRERLSAVEGVRAAQAERLALQDERLERLASTQVEQVESLSGTDARIGSLIGQINERMLPEVNARLARQRETVDRLDREVSRLREHLVHRLEQAAATSLGADPVDTVAGALGSAGTSGEPGPSGTGSSGSGSGGSGSSGGTEAGGELTRAYERLAATLGMRVELTAPASYRTPGAEHASQTRYYLSGRSPRSLESDFIDLLELLRTTPEDDHNELDAVRALLAALGPLEYGGAQLGPLVIVRTPEALTCGVLPLAELTRTKPAALVADPDTTATHLGHLPEVRVHTLVSP